MKLGTLLSSVSASVLVIAQPAAATRSAESLPSVSAYPSASSVRLGSNVGDAEGLKYGSSLFWLIVGIIGLAAALVLVLDEDNNDPDDLPTPTPTPTPTSP